MLHREQLLQKRQISNRILELIHLNLPDELEGFTLKKIFAPHDDKYIYFTYEDASNHYSLTAYFHEETKEYKLRQKIGLTEFCLTNFLSS